MDDAGIHTLSDYRSAFHDGRTTPSRQIEEVYRRIAAHDDPSMFITLRPMAEVLDEARDIELHGSKETPLYGIPVAIKDNIDVAGTPTTVGCPDFAWTPERDATVVARLRAAGAIIVGKTNMDQFATGLVGVRSPYGITRNAIRAELVPGGSSSGSATAVAAGIVPLALGTDTAGSGRVPAALNNIVGLKPTPGLVSTTGVFPACRTIDCVSVFALTVDDAYAAIGVMAGYDPDDPYSRKGHVGMLGSLPPGLIVGVPDQDSRFFGGDALAEQAFDANVANLARMGFSTREIDLRPLFDVAALLYDGPWIVERYQAIDSFMDAHPASIYPVTRSIIAQASRFSASDVFRGMYKLAASQRAAEHTWHEIDVLMVPTIPRPRTIADLEHDPITPNTEFGTYTNFVNLLNLCALAVPGKFRDDGLPSGCTLISTAGRDALIGSLGLKVHAASAVPLGATSRAMPAFPEPEETASDDKIELAVVGAHLSGFPLNKELVSLGARFVRTGQTRPEYRFFALQGDGPRRPGLLRVSDGDGHSIEAEVWALRPDAFGSFVARIPSPLAIGTIRMADGSAPKGFIVESAATDGAEDISKYGGWRAFMRQETFGR